MQRLLFLLSVSFGIFSSASAQSPKFVSFSDVQKKDQFTISGQYENYTGEPTVIRTFDYGIFTDELTNIQIDSSGSFSAIIPIYYSHEIKLWAENRNYTILAHPGSKIRMDILEERTVFYGDDAEINTLLYEHKKVIGKKFQVRPWERDELIKMNPLSYRNLVDSSYYKGSVASAYFFDSLTAVGVRIPDYIIRNRRLEMDMAYLNALNSFAPTRKYYSKKEGTDLAKIPKAFYQDMLVNEIIIEETDYTYCDIEELFSKSFMDKSLEQIKIKFPMRRVVVKILDKASKDLSPFSYELFFSYVFGYRADFNFKESLYSRYQREVETVWLKDEMNYVYHAKPEEVSVLLDAQTDTTDATNLDPEEVLSLIAKKHAGKKVYVDIWATWCTNCIWEFAFAEELHAAVDLDKVAFVYIGARSEKTAWLERLDKTKLNGDHYLISDDTYNKFKKRWNLRGVPHYAILDTDGSLLEMDAPRPTSNGQLNEELVNLLNE